MAPSKHPKKNIAAKVLHFENLTIHKKIEEQRNHSLQCLPDYPIGHQRHEYIDLSEASKTLAKFRLGNANLGNRDNPPVKICPACNIGPNKESHLVFNVLH